MTNQTEVAAATNTGTGAQVAAPVQPKEISTSFILGRLNEGKSREEIREELGLKKSQFNRLMKHPTLKNKKSKTAARHDPFVVIDDVAPATATAAASNAAAPGTPGYGFAPDSPEAGIAQ